MKNNKYVKYIKKSMFILIVLLTVLLIVFDMSFTNLIFKDKKYLDNYSNKFNYGIKINNIATSSFTISPGNSVLEVKINSLNKTNSYYKIVYQSNPSLNIYYYEGLTTDIISSNSIKTIKLFVNNSSNENITGTIDVIGSNINNIYVTDGFKDISNKLSIGDYINYVPNGVNDVTKYNISKEYTGSLDDQEIFLQKSKWRILNINGDGTLEIIANSLNINKNNDKLSLNGSLGYNNGVYAINNIINNLYGNGKYAISGRNINVSDIEKYLNNKAWNYEKFENNCVTPNRYGGIKSYNNAYYPSMWNLETDSSIESNNTSGILNQNDNGELTIDESNIGNITIKQNYWTNTLTRSNFISPIYYELFMNNGSYWLTSRYVNAFDSYAIWGLYNIYDNHVSGSMLYSSINEKFNNKNSIRPIVKLSKNIKLNKINNTWNIE